MNSKCQAMWKDLLVPVTLGVLVECWKHDRENFGCVIADQAHDIFVVPIVQGSLCHLQWERKPSLKRLLPVIPVVHRETNCAVLRPELATTQPRSKCFPTAWAAGLTFANLHKAIHPCYPAFFPLGSVRHFSLSWGKPHILD